MICVYPADCMDFSTNGNGTLSPLSAVVTETMNGEYELELVHPIDEAGKWQRLVEGCILRAPVPASMTPRVNFASPGDDSRTEVWRIETDFAGAETRRGTLRLRTGPGTNYRVIASYKNGSLVQVLNKTNSGWYEVTAPDGKRGYMSTTYLRLDHTEGSVSQAVSSVVRARQLRDQPFRIYRVVPELDKITVYARHVFYDLLDNMVKSYKPSPNAAGASVVQTLSASCLSPHDFTFYSDLDTTAEEVAFENVNPVEALLGEGGVIEKYRGELTRDWWDVFVVKRVGTDNEVQIREAKNLLGISYDVDLTNVVTRILPTGEDKDGNVLYLPEVYIDSPNINSYPHPKWIHLAVQDAKEETEGEEIKTKEQCYAEMRKEARAQFESGCDLPTVTLNVDFINCADTEEYRDYGFLQNIYLGDAVRVIAPRIGVWVSMRMTQYAYDCLTEKYTQMTLGTVADTVEGNIISARQLPSGIITGSKLAINSVGQGALRSGSVGNVQIKLAAIETAHIQDAAITKAKITEAAIGSAQIENAAITQAKIGEAAIGSAQIADAAIERAKIKEGAIGSAQIDTGVITSAHIGSGEILSAHIQDGAIVHAKIGDAAIGAANIQDGSIDAAKIRDAAITNAKIAGAAIGTANIQDGAIVRAKILDGEITTAKIADLSVTDAKIADLAVTTAKIAQAAITNAQIANAAIDTAQIALGAITAALIQNGAVGTAQIADASVTDAKIVELTANKITAGVLSVERLIIRGNEQSLVYAINNMGELVSTQVDTIDGYVLTERTITADKIVAHAITANELAAHTITANEILSGTITSAEIAAGTITGSNIKAGTLTTSHVAADFGQTLDLSSNQSVALSVEQALSDMEIGGRNYLLQSETSRLLSPDDAYFDYALSEALRELEDRHYVFSADLMATQALTIGVSIINQNGTGMNFMPPNSLSAGEELHFTQTITLLNIESPSNAAGFRIRITAGTGVLRISNAKLESGTVATAYLPAPEDGEGILEEKLAAIRARITADGDGIRQEIRATYALATDLDRTSRQVSTLSEQTQNNFTWSVTNINRLSGDLAQAKEATEEQLRILHTYMTFDENGLVIGKTGNPFTFRVVNDRLAFYMNDTEVAYLSNNKLYVTQAEILSKLVIGRFAFEPQTNGNLSLVYVG